MSIVDALRPGLIVVGLLLFAVLAAGGPLAAAADEGWYPFQPTDSTEPGAIGMTDWLEKPAGKHGRIHIDGEKLIYNGQPIKLWGLNNAYATCAPERPLADKRAAFYAKMGVNAVRLHKYANGSGWRGICTDQSFVKFNPDLLDRMDYYVAQLKAHGIYTKLSPSFGVRLGPDDRHYQPDYFDELVKRNNGESWPRVPYGAVYFVPEFQQVVIDQMLEILKHRNPHTKVTYVEDPAIAVIEIINEDSVLWWGTGRELQRSDFLRKRAAELFSDWLRKRYGDEAGLIKAWGDNALNCFAGEQITGESLADNTVVPFGSPWFFDPKNIEENHPHARKRLHDTMLFLYELQNGFYDRFTDAVRKVGWDGPIVASNWQAGSMYSHYYNLHSDARIGIVDRHNYFGGGRGVQRGNPWNNASMLAKIGSGTLSVGLQQVDDRPFMLSEWIHVWPNEWGVEGPALIGAYGMGLNGWDASYMFQNGDDGGFVDRLGGSGWEVTAPQVIGVFPAVSRQVHRGDVRESDHTLTLNVHVPSLYEGKLDFVDRVAQQFDVKTFNSDKIPAAALAAERVAVKFTDKYQPTPAVPLEPDGTINSSTGQLSWTSSDQPQGGFFTMDTDGTKAVVGFADGKTFELGDVTIAMHCRFGALYITAAEPDKTLAESNRWLVVAIARAHNTGFEIKETDKGTVLVSRGEQPILMEPVKADVTIQRKGGTLMRLDHDGRRTDRTRPIEGGRFAIDGAADQTPYYLIEFGD